LSGAPDSLFDEVGDGHGIGDIDGVAARDLNNRGAGPFRDELLRGIRNHLVVAAMCGRLRVGKSLRRIVGGRIPRSEIR
jgi:hypothetical protein